MQYEAICAFHPSTDEAKIDALVQKFSDRIQSVGGKVDNVDKKGLKDLPFKFQNFKDLKQAYYVYLNFSGEGRVPNEFRGLIRVTEEVIRHIVTRAN